ncbi:MAG: SDR family NAD(P)-dependent oxidoreductase [Burkholderiales bacterium]|jgi:UDP-glucose 4-epimerase|nr:SDR family NAD(P)-dependent oxidoreductase [Burkholderiales bacterium]MBW8892249.1 SDR family NAD(P)-dependent oxidoreductase [Burkholderiales bacterium]
MILPTRASLDAWSKHALILGGAGFIGANLVRRLLDAGQRVTVIDNLSRGSEDLLAPYRGQPGFTFIRADLSAADSCKRAFDDANRSPIQEVWHLAANSDIPAGVSDPRIDLRDTFMTTFEALRNMRRLGLAILHFASSSAVYGDWKDTPLHESLGPLKPISNYGAMKLASEAQICAAKESFLSVANVFRFPNVVGAPATHGVIHDFIKRLRDDPAQLEVLGNGTQQKAYLHVDELINAMLVVCARESAAQTEIVNIGPADSGASVRSIAESVVARVSPSARITYGESDRGWVGDVPRFRYSIERIRSFGWEPQLDSLAAVRRAVDDIAREWGL